jgi:hypothetical protein
MAAGLAREARRYLRASGFIERTSAQAGREIDMDRRTFVTASAGLAALGCTLIGLPRHGLANEARKRAMTSAPVLIVIDATLAESRAYGEAFDAAHRLPLSFGADVGALWHARLRDWTGPISGALRPSDCFVLQTFSLAQGRAFRFLRCTSRQGEGPATITPAERACAFLIEAALPRVARGA